MLSLPGLVTIITLIFFTLAIFLISFFYNKRITNYVFGFAIFLAFFTVGLILIKKEKTSITCLASEPTTFLSTLSDYPEEKEKTYLVTIELNSAYSEGIFRNVKGSMILYHRKDSLISTLRPGDKLTVKCTPLEIVNRGNPCEFDYKSYMESRGIKYYAFTGKQNILSYTIATKRKLQYSALIIRERIIKMYEERGVTGDRLALVSAITLGQKRMLDPEVKQIFINAGVMHIMAVSGLHAVILSLFIFNLLFFLKGKYNILRVIITLLILWAFAFVTGLGPSMLRATLMFTFLQAGNLMNRKVNGINSVLASAFVLIMLQPSVITDAGFLLSYSAVIYIIGFYHLLYLNLQFRDWLTDKVWQSVVVTLVAQAGTLPLTIMLFNRFPVYFILTNVIIVPLSNVLIIVGCIIPLAYPLVPLSEFLAFILDKLTGLTEFLTAKAASLPYSTLDHIGITPIECILLTLAISLLLVFLLRKPTVSIKYPVFAFILFAIVMNIKRIENRRTDELIVYNNPSFPTTGIRTGNTLYLVSLSDSIPPEVQRHAATRGLKISCINGEIKPCLFKAGNIKILITDSLKQVWLRDNDFNILILTGKRPYIEKNISSRYLPGTIVVTSEAASGYYLPVAPEKLKGKTISYVKKSGAYISRL
jgi:competence protein ComEC